MDLEPTGSFHGYFDCCALGVPEDSAPEGLDAFASGQKRDAGAPSEAVPWIGLCVGGPRHRKQTCVRVVGIGGYEYVIATDVSAPDRLLRYPQRMMGGRRIGRSVLYG